MSKARMLRASAALATVTAATVVAVGGPATASTTQKAGATVITMEQDGRELFFDGPATVERGATLKIKNKTDPRKIGPHTFSLAREAHIPVTERQIKNCGKKLAKLCGAVVEWHEVDLQSEEIGENPVEVGKDGWDTKGSLKRTGDSWVAEAEGASHKREVTAPEGKTLQFFCAVHPEMQGEIKVAG